MLLPSLATIRRDMGPNQISRENVQRKIVVQSNVAGRDVGSVAEDMRRRIAEEVTLPESYYIEYGGQFESAQVASRTIGWLSLLAVTLIFLLLFMEFGSARQAFLVMVNLPLALVGGVFAIVLTGGVLNIATMVGFITLFGIAVRNGILLVSHYNHLVEEGRPLREAVWKGSMERLSPDLHDSSYRGIRATSSGARRRRSGERDPEPVGNRRFGGTPHRPGAQYAGGSRALSEVRGATSYFLTGLCASVRLALVERRSVGMMVTA